MQHSLKECNHIIKLEGKRSLGSLKYGCMDNINDV
jgi:hypothetical protein